MPMMSAVLAAAIEGPLATPETGKWCRRADLNRGPTDYEEWSWAVGEF
jgi:hypothetical protein